MEATTRGGGFTHAFGYDPAENPTQFRGGGVPTANADNQLGGTYDGNGNPTGGGFTFDVENRVTNTGSMIETWGANGLRASEGGTYFLYDGSVPVCEMMGTGSVGVTNTFGASGLLSRHTSSGSVFYTFDPMGNVAQRYTSTGSLVSSDLYDSFGFATSTASPTDPFGYEGKFGYYTEGTTGLVLCGHRFYSTITGRFINRDPIGYAGGNNLYGYVGNNAVNAADPSGFGETDGRTPSDWAVFLAGVWAAMNGAILGQMPAKTNIPDPVPPKASSQNNHKQKNKNPGAGGGGGGSSFSSCPFPSSTMMPTPGLLPPPSGLPGISGISDPLWVPPLYPNASGSYPNTSGAGQGNQGFPADQPIFGDPAISPGIEAGESGGALSLLLLIVLVVA